MNNFFDHLAYLIAVLTCCSLACYQKKKNFFFPINPKLEKAWSGPIALLLSVVWGRQLQ